MADSPADARNLMGSTPGHKLLIIKEKAQAYGENNPNPLSATWPTCI